MEKPRYVYQSAQDSILRPYYQRWVWQPALGRLPASLSPNALTLISTLCCATSFLLAAAAPSSAAAMVTASLCVFAYLSLDNMDGAHARNTGQSSRLGEFLDHWLDTLNNGFVILGACLAVGLSSFFTLLVLAAGTLAFFAVQLELRHTGVFRMGRVADIEGNTAVSLLYLGVAFLGPDFFLEAPAEGWPSLALLLGAGVMGQAIWTFASALYRLQGGRLDCLPLLFCLAGLVVWANLAGPALSGGTGAALLAAGFFANPVFTSSPILARLRGHSTRVADRVAAAAVVAAVMAASTGLGPSLELAWATALGLVGMTLYYALSTVAALRHEPSVANVSPDTEDAPQP